MGDRSHLVVLARELEELVPEFMANRRKDLQALRVGLTNDDLEGLRLIGDRIKGVAGSYGFVRLAAIARLIEETAKQGNRHGLYLLVEQYEAHLSSVEIRFEDTA